VGVVPRAANSSIRHVTYPKANAKQNSSLNGVELPPLSPPGGSGPPGRELQHSPQHTSLKEKAKQNSSPNGVELPPLSPPGWEWPPGPRTPAFATTQTQKQTPIKTARPTGLSPPPSDSNYLNSSIKTNNKLPKGKQPRLPSPTRSTHGELYHARYFSFRAPAKRPKIDNRQRLPHPVQHGRSK
jgi:hypothetical protein